MCGIAGWYDKDLDFRDCRSILDEMSLTLANRGPDSSGIFIEEPVFNIRINIK